MFRNAFVLQTVDCPKNSETVGQADSTINEFKEYPRSQNELQVCFPEMGSQQLEIKPSFPVEKNLNGAEVVHPLADENVKKDGGFHVVPCIGSVTGEAVFDEHLDDFISDEENSVCQTEDDQSVPLWEKEE